MRVKAATTAFLWRFKTSFFKAAYGRYSNNTEYSKNYLQTDKGPFRNRLIDLLDHSGQPGSQVPITIKWPGGELETKFSVKNQGTDTRGEIYITDGTSLATKRVTEPFVPGDVTDLSKALVGDPKLPTPGDANNLLQSIEQLGEKPWFMLVALEGEYRVLHARMFLENPPAGREHLGLDRQPSEIQEAVRSAGSSDDRFLVELGVPLRAEKIISQVQDAFDRSPNVLLVGPPGCGKSVALEDLMALYQESAWFDQDASAPWAPNSRKVFETAFHPGLAYENFVAGLTPAAGPGITLEVRSGPLLNMAQWCRGEGREGLLVIDEFNRGPAASIFGDALVLLDKGKRAGVNGSRAGISQPHSDHDIVVPPEFSSDGSSGELVPKRFALPAGLRILGAFNSSDRSVAPLDAALLRRFAIVRVGADAEVLASHLGFVLFDAADIAYQSKDVSQWTAEDVRRLTVHLLISLNDRVRAILGEDHELGHALLWEVPADASLEETVAILAAEFEEKVVGRLRLTLRDKDEQLAVILNAPELGSAQSDCVAEWLDEDSRVGRLVGPRLRIHNLKEEPASEQIKRLLSVVLPD
jgi:5-methylcytosine-specific restriction protein B